MIPTIPKLRHAADSIRACAEPKFTLYWISPIVVAQPAITCSKLAIETIEQTVKYVQS